MKVKELIQLLQEKDPDMLVILAKDEEGNGFGGVEAIGTGVFHEDILYNDFAEFEEEYINYYCNPNSSMKDIVKKEARECVCIWPLSSVRER